MSMQSPSAKPLKRALHNNSPPDDNIENDSSKDKKSLNSQCESNYDVLTIIFKKLNARDLCNAARICRCWSAVAEIEKRIRTDLPLTLAITFDDVKDSWTNWRTYWRTVHRSDEDKTDDCPCESLPSNCQSIIIVNLKVVADQLSWTKDDDQNIQKVSSIFLPEARDVTYLRFIVNLLIKRVRILKKDLRVLC